MFKKLVNNYVERERIEVKSCPHTLADVCNCPCHKNSFKSEHFIECCVYCEFCQNQIKTDRFLAWCTTI